MSKSTIDVPRAELSALCLLEQAVTRLVRGNNQTKTREGDVVVRQKEAKQLLEILNKIQSARGIDITGPKVPALKLVN